MPVTYTANLGDRTQAAVPSIVQSVTVPAHNNGILIIGYMTTIWPNTHSCTVDGAGASAIGVRNQGGTRASLWYKVNPAEGTYNVICDNNGNNAGNSIGVLLFEGVDQDVPFVGTPQVAGSDSASSATVTLVGIANGMGVATGANYNESSIGVGAGEIEVYENIPVANQGRHNQAYEARGNDNNFDMSVTSPGTGEIMIVGQCLKPSSDQARGSHFFFTLAGIGIPAATLAGLYKAGAVAL